MCIHTHNIKDIFIGMELEYLSQVLVDSNDKSVIISAEKDDRQEYDNEVAQFYHELLNYFKWQPEEVSLLVTERNLPHNTDCGVFFIENNLS